MDALTLLAAGLVGGGVATVTLVLVVAVRLRQTRIRRREAGPRRTRGPRSAPSRPATARPLPPPAVRPQDARRSASGLPVPPQGALGGETLQLGPVPAWKVPVTSPSAGPPPRRGGGHLFGRRRGEYTSAAASLDADGRVAEPRLADATNDREQRDPRGGPSVTANASRRHDPRTAAGRTPTR